MPVSDGIALSIPVFDETGRRVGGLVPSLDTTAQGVADLYEVRVEVMERSGANTISQKAPFGEPMNELTQGPSPAIAGTVSTGVYNVLPVFRGTHVALTGDVLSPNLRGPEYLLHVMEMINAL